MRRGIEFWLIHSPGWVLLLYLVYAQAIPAFDYDTGVAMGTQESAEAITDVGVAFWWGFAFADLVFYIPLLTAGLIGHLINKAWGPLALGAALGITIYWPIVCLAAIYDAHGLEGWTLPDESAYWIVLPAIALWASWSLWQLLETSGPLNRSS